MNWIFIAIAVVVVKTILIIVFVFVLSGKNKNSNNTIDNNIPDNNILDDNIIDNNILDNNIPDNNTIDNNIPQPCAPLNCKDPETLNLIKAHYKQRWMGLGGYEMAPININNVDDENCDIHYSFTQNGFHVGYDNRRFNVLQDDDCLKEITMSQDPNSGVTAVNNNNNDNNNNNNQPNQQQCAPLSIDCHNMGIAAQISAYYRRNTPYEMGIKNSVNFDNTTCDVRFDYYNNDIHQGYDYRRFSFDQDEDCMKEITMGDRFSGTSAKCHNTLNCNSSDTLRILRQTFPSSIGITTPKISNMIVRQKNNNTCNVDVPYHYDRKKFGNAVLTSLDGVKSFDAKFDVTFDDPTRANCQYTKWRANHNFANHPKTSINSLLLDSPSVNLNP